MFSSITMAPPDSILGLAEAFKKDPRPHKINLSIGVYCDESGKTPVLPSVKEAERRLLAGEQSKSYLPIEGTPLYGQQVQAMQLGATHEAVTSKRIITAHTPSGTAALRVAADFIKKNLPSATVWISDPTWPNHPQIFQAAGLHCKTYPYFDPAANDLAFDKMLSALATIPAGDVVLLHGCCHNPSGIDPTPAQWRSIAQTLQQRRVIPFLDFAYQGFGRGLEEDAIGLRELVTPGAEVIVASSFSKNFGLYNERVGALSVVAADADAATRVMSQVKSAIRANYSNPPCHGGAIVSTILSDPALKAQWENELAQMRRRIQSMRELFVHALRQNGVTADFSFITRQLGMFSFSGLTKAQVDRLRDEFAVYVVGNGRINVAGMTPANMPALAQAIKAVM